MDMHSLRSKISKLVILCVAVVSAIATAGDGDGSASSGVVIDVNGASRGLYPIATPLAPEGDAASKEVAQIESTDLGLAGVFKVVDPSSFLADLKTEALNIDPPKWKDVGAFGVVKYRVTADQIEFRLYEVAKGNSAVLTKMYKRTGSTNRQIVHRWCNEVVKYYTKENGFFGSQIAFTAKGKGTSQIMAMDFDGTNAYVVSHNTSTNILPAWSPSGGLIAYTSFMRNNPDLYVGAPNGSRPKKISAQKGMNNRRGVLAGWLEDRADLVEGRQPGDLHHQRERRLGRSQAHERQVDRYVAGMVARWQHDRVRL